MGNQRSVGRCDWMGEVCATDVSLIDSKLNRDQCKSRSLEDIDKHFVVYSHKHL